MFFLFNITAMTEQEIRKAVKKLVLINVVLE